MELEKEHGQCSTTARYSDDERVILIFEMFYGLENGNSKESRVKMKMGSIVMEVK